MQKRLLDGFGAEIEGFDITAAHGDDAWRAVVGAAHEHGYIVLKNQKTDAKSFEAFSRRFGEPKPHVLTQFHVEGHATILRLSNIVEDGEPLGIYDGANYWHTDMAYEDPPGAATVVYALQVPAEGGATLVADMYRAYDDLSPSMKDRIEGLTVLHHYGNRDDLDEDSAGSASKLTDEQKAKVVNVFHKLVRPHPTTGRKALYAVSGSSFGIVGMPDDEAIALLDELKAHAVKPDYVSAVQYEAGDVGVWDNTCTLHSATFLAPVTSAEDPQARMMHRISVKGVSPLF